MNIAIDHFDSDGNKKTTFSYVPVHTHLSSSDGGTITAAAVSDFSEAVDDRVNALVSTDASITKVYDDASNALAFYGASSIFQARLTPTSGIPYVTTDATAVTTVYLTPSDGNLVAVYDGTRTRAYALTSDISIKLTDTQSGTLTSGIKTITGLTDTSQLIVGMKVTGTNVGASAVISTIDSPTQVTVSVNSTGSGGSSITFKVAASTLLDIFVYQNSGNLKLEMLAWASTSARATALSYQDGYLIKNGDPTRRFAGCVYTTTTDGQTERSRGTNNAGSTTADLGGHCYIVNYYNQRMYAIQFLDTTSHSYQTAAFRQWLANTNAKCQFISCSGDYDVTVTVAGALTVQNTQSAGFAVSFNSTTRTSADPTFYFGASTFNVNINSSGAKNYPVALGLNYAAPLEGGQVSDSHTIINVTVNVPC